jgi:acyl-CoA thioester hydrolase
MTPPGEPVTTITTGLRYRDLDTLGHLNQSVYHVLLEDARIALLRSVFGGTPRMVMARVELDHRREVRIGDRQVTTATTVRRVGRSSVTLAARMTVPSGAVVAEAVSVLVAWDDQARVSRPFDASERAALEALAVAG